MQTQKSKTLKSRKKDFTNALSMEILNPHAAGIDVGSREHWVAVGQDPHNDVRVFGVYTSEHEKMIKWLLERGVITIALEATGAYWQTLFSALELAGFSVHLCSSKTIKNPEGKTDQKDSRWLQKLHSFGILKDSFLPEATIIKLRQYCRHRSTLVKECSRQSNRMMKVMQLMNIRLEVVLSDITGASGMSIINAILQGERDGNKLAALANSNVKKSKEEIASALIGNWKEELLYELQDLMDMYNFHQTKIQQVDKKIEHQLMEMKDENIVVDESKIIRKKKQKGQPKCDIAKLSYQYYGVNLVAIDGLSDNVILTLISEVGKDIKKFNAAKSFSKWLRLSPENRKTGGKIISSYTPKGRNALSVALRNAANTIGQRKEGSFKAFFKRIAYKNGRAAAITATARKLAVIIWNMITKRQEYMPMEEEGYKEKVKMNVVNNMRKNIKRLNITAEEFFNMQYIDDLNRMPEVLSTIFTNSKLHSSSTMQNG
jgi:transposase